MGRGAEAPFASVFNRRVVSASFVVEGHAGATTHLPGAPTSRSEAYFIAGSFTKSWWVRTLTNPNTGQVYRLGSATLKISANGLGLHLEDPEGQLATGHPTP